MTNDSTNFKMPEVAYIRVSSRNVWSRAAGFYRKVNLVKTTNTSYIYEYRNNDRMETYNFSKAKIDSCNYGKMNVRSHKESANAFGQATFITEREYLLQIHHYSFVGETKLEKSISDKKLEIEKLHREIKEAEEKLAAVRFDNQSIRQELANASEVRF